MSATRRQTSKRTSRPALTPEQRENQLIAKAYDRAEQQIDDGTVSSQVLTEFLRLGSTRGRLEQERLRYDTMKLEAQTEELKARATMEELYTNAMRAFGTYRGEEVELEMPDDYDYD